MLAVSTEKKLSWVDSFSQTYAPLIGSTEGEQEFAAILNLTVGLSSPKLGHLLNHAVRLMPRHNCYVEIGTFTGYTLLSAAHQNPHKTCIGIDNYRPDFYPGKTAESARKRMLVNLEHFDKTNVKMFNCDFRKVEFQQTNIGVLLIDGDHRATEVMDSLEWADKVLADNALVFLDDISSSDVYRGVEQWLSRPRNGGSYREIFKLHVSYPDGDHHWNPVFWNGLSILQFQREVA